MRATFLLAVLPAALATGASGPPGPLPFLKFGLVTNQPAAGRARVPLDQAVVQVRHNYGRFSLVRLTDAQESALREAGYEVRIFENPDRIGLGRHSFIVPEGPTGLPLDLTWRETRGETDAYLVRLIGPATDEWLSQIRSAGGEILTPIPSFAYLVRVPANRRPAVASLAFVEWMGPYHPAFKLSDELAQQHERGSLPETALKLSVLIYRSADVEAALNKIRALRGEILNRSPFDFYDVVTVNLSGRLVPDLARLSEVYAVEVAPEPRLEDESSTQILVGQVSGGIPFRPVLGEPNYTDWLAARSLDGSNVTIGYVDEGVLNTDPTGHLSGRVNETACGTAGLAGTGHGHFGASNAGGACPHTGESGTGFRFGLGVAPSVNFINLPSLNACGNCFTNISDSSALARLTVTSNGPVNGVPGTVQNNSWGSGSGDNAEDVSYGSLERTYDLLSRDANSMAAGNQPLITCFSAG
ncbi:MAG: hypothetical protein DMH00_00620, partial [Acidobacteria bacterium]